MDELLLVHVSAPSTASDDARYRAQVAAIRDYLYVPSQHAADLTEQPPPQHTSAASVFARRDLSNSPRHTFQRPPNQIWNRDRHNELECDDEPVHDPQPFSPIASPGPALDRSRQEYDHDSLESLVSVIPDSQPDLSSPPAHAGPVLQGARDVSPPLRRQHEHEDSGSFVASSSPTSKRRRTGTQDGDICDPPVNDGKTPARSLLETNISQSPPEQSIHHQQQAANPTSTTPLRLDNLPLQIHPPPPPVSTAPFTTHITPTLAMLTARLEPARTYKPTRQTRALDKLERGYWAAQIPIVSEEQQTTNDKVEDNDKSKNSAKDPDQDQDDHANNPQRSRTGAQSRNCWSAPLFARFWAFLSEFIGNDARAGWGVWCVLDRVGGESSALMPGSSRSRFGSQSGSDSDSDSVCVLLRVYAWGEVAMHVYLVLFLASERRVRGLGLQWVDSREEVVIQMP